MTEELKAEDFGTIEEVKKEEVEAPKKSKAKKQSVDNIFAMNLADGKFKREFNRGPFKMFCTNGSSGLMNIGIHEWNGTHWIHVMDEDGETLAMNWLNARADQSTEETPYASKLNKRSMTQMWEMAKVMMRSCNPAIVNGEDKINSLNNLVIPTLGHYLTLKDGRFFVEFPNPDYNLRYVINIDLRQSQRPIGDMFVELQDGRTEYIPSSDLGDSYFGKYITQTFKNKEVRSVVQEYSGSTFFETSFQRGIWMTGTGSNGKGVYQRLLLKMFGRNGKSLMMGDLDGQFALYPLSNASVICVPEVEDEHIPEGKLKALIGGDYMSVREIYQSSFNQCFLGKWIINSQNPPIFKDKTDGWYRRWIFIEVDNKVEEKDQIVNLEELIYKNDMEIFFDWCMLGCKKISLRKALIPFEELPELIKDNNKSIRGNNNSVIQWLDCNPIEIVEDDKIESFTERTKIMNSYTSFCEIEIGQKSLGAEKFWNEISRILNKRILKKSKRMNGKVVPVSNIKFLGENHSRDFNILNNIPSIVKF